MRIPSWSRTGTLPKGCRSMFGRFRLALKHVEWHLFELREALFGHHHLDGAHVGGVIESQRVISDIAIVSYEPPQRRRLGLSAFTDDATPGLCRCRIRRAGRRA